jgi:N-acetylglucosamine-6-phosphate deacetylase
VLAHGADKLVLVSDAIAAAGLADDSYQLAGRDVVVKHGEARLADDGCLAGSTITMQDAVRRAVTVAGLPVAVAAAAAATNPARVLGIDNECGWMAAGLAADLVLLDDDYRVQRVMTSGDG